MTPTPTEIQMVCRKVNELCGIQWDASKTYLIESRLKPLLSSFNLPSYEALIRALPLNHKLRIALIDAVTTRETLFFRDDTAYQALEYKALPEIIDIRAKSIFPKKLRIWSAACSSGQEPYSIGMLLHRMIPDIYNWDIQIHATDISEAAIAHASRGRYSDLEMSRGVPADMKSRYFTRVGSEWQIIDPIRSLVSFEKRNLLEPFTGLGHYDIIFCRNVAIYFDLPIKRDLFERLANVMETHGVLMVGTSENLLGYGPRWAPQRHCRSVYYRPNLQEQPC
ncbi:protein-glutamate O-methyltransferase CheR [Rubinisphaera sp.]|uniref:CheR family methyltransferase n=1 Tax=Rubinisphaera sp. TaxID=2024857 RepID=UPI000C119CC6|nr:protein-glutamate O-methyltransferase CheR [Rubinisphaera sp.]MBV12123.1 chemotaxis protein CheR [Rubinisphaera sp.]HCS55874.1 chemotaxis protein CheR [Planctomycetaceae bacterium]